MKNWSASWLTVMARLADLTMLLLAATGSSAVAQNGCLKGNVFGPARVNLTMRVCPELDAKAPEIQKRLNDLDKSLNGNQALLREVIHAMRGINALGRDVDANRQLELLTSFNKELQVRMAIDTKQSLEQMAELASKLDDLREAIARDKEDEKTAQQTNEALKGQLGRAIASLDLTNANQQLESIQTKLDTIGADTQQTRRILEQQAAREKEAEQRALKAAEEQDNDPNMYTRAQIMPSRSPRDGQLRLMIFFYSRPPLYPPFIDSALSIAFRKETGEAWRIDATDKQVSAGGELWHLNLNADDIGDKATICFVARDQKSSRQRVWVQHYKTTPANTATLGVNFIPDRSSSMHLTDGEPCDGVMDARKVQVPPAAPPLDEQLKQQRAKSQEQLAKVQEQIAAMHDQAYAAMHERSRAFMSSPASFAHVTVEALRQDGSNGGHWQIKVNTQAAKVATQLYDVKVEANLVDEAGGTIPLQLSNRQLFANIESRYALIDQLGTKAVVCLTAKDPARDRPYRLTQWFSIETSRANWKYGGAAVPGDTATFVPSQPPSLTEASDAACK